MFAEEEKKKKTSYGSIFVYCFFCVVLVVGLVRFAKPYDNLRQNLMEAEAVVEEGFFDVKNSGKPPCQSSRSRSISGPAHNHEKLTAPAWVYRELSPTSYCVKFESFATMMKQVKDGKYESRPFSVGGHNWYVHVALNLNFVFFIFSIYNLTFLKCCKGRFYYILTGTSKTARLRDTCRLT